MSILGDLEQHHVPVLFVHSSEMHFVVDDATLEDIETGLHVDGAPSSRMSASGLWLPPIKPYSVFHRLRDMVSVRVSSTIFQALTCPSNYLEPTERPESRTYDGVTHGPLKPAEHLVNAITLSPDERTREDPETCVLRAPIDIEIGSDVPAECPDSQAGSPDSVRFPGSLSSPSSSYATPPLTPDSSSGLLTSSGSSFLSLETVFNWMTTRDHDDVKSQMNTPHRQAIREGKKRERAVCFDTLIADITNETATGGDAAIAGDDNQGEEWYGLEYIMELSRRDQRAREDHVFSAGESSKSHKSWALIHEGTIDPYYEDDEYRRWRQWHRSLEKREERRKMKMAYVFVARSEDLALVFLEEMKMREWMRRQKERDYASAHWGHLKDHLVYLAERRPDPFFPRAKHGQAWELTRSRSSCCLRELRPTPPLG
ncbi:hypothetical protein HYDPIDRAFT_35777 [Hydnomerulius pinastri MD-312]|nr:hypothetical protein HYDPIDRAFT_35777 [Hydnomerulius pinastri MD-312]